MEGERKGKGGEGREEGKWWRERDASSLQGDKRSCSASVVLGHRRAKLADQLAVNQKRQL